MERISEFAIAFSLNLIAGLFVWLVTARIDYALLASVLLLTGVFVYYLNHSFRSVGIITWARRRGVSKSFRSCLATTDVSIDFLATWGGSIPSLSPYIERTFQDMVQRGCTFRFLLLRPGSPGERRRRKTRESWPPGQPETDIRWLLHVKMSLGELSERFQVALYSDEPVWAMVLIDNRRAIVGYYGRGVGRDNPGLVVQQRKDGKSFFEAFAMEYERVWDRATRVQTVEDFDKMIMAEGHEKERSIILAVLGPSGAGKTSVCIELVRRSLGVHSQTVTTRPPYTGEEYPGQYEYVTSEKFSSLSDGGHLVCDTRFSDHRYGLRTQMVFEPLEKNKVLILDTIIPPRLLRQRLGKRVVTVFLTPRSSQVLKERIRDQVDVRGSGDLRSRYAETDRLLGYAEHSDYIFFTDSLGKDRISDYLAILVKKASVVNRLNELSTIKELEEFRATRVISERGMPSYEPNGH